MPDIIQPEELAVYLSQVFRDEEASTFERTQAAVGLTAFWLGAQMELASRGFEETA